jgi:hypothetical protein
MIASNPDPTPVNVLGDPLETCGTDPVTGFFRDGCCNTDSSDRGSHTVCAVMTADFLAFTAAAGNDLSTPHPEYNFPGLKPGDRWCLCVSRWEEARRAGRAPEVVLAATHQAALKVTTLEHLQAAEHQG